jgi:hypothetical protein
MRSRAPHTPVVYTLHATRPAALREGAVNALCRQVAMEHLVANMSKEVSRLRALCETLSTRPDMPVQSATDGSSDNGAPLTFGLRRPPSGPLNSPGRARQKASNGPKVAAPVVSAPRSQRSDEVALPGTLATPLLVRRGMQSPAAAAESGGRTTSDQRTGSDLTARLAPHKANLRREDSAHYFDTIREEPVESAESEQGEQRAAGERPDADADMDSVDARIGNSAAGMAEESTELVPHAAVAFSEGSEYVPQQHEAAVQEADELVPSYGTSVTDRLSTAIAEAAVNDRAAGAGPRRSLVGALCSAITAEVSGGASAERGRPVTQPAAPSAPVVEAMCDSEHDARRSHEDGPSVLRKERAGVDKSWTAQRIQLVPLPVPSALDSRVALQPSSLGESAQAPPAAGPVVGPASRGKLRYRPHTSQPPYPDAGALDTSVDYASEAPRFGAGLETPGEQTPAGDENASPRLPQETRSLSSPIWKRRLLRSSPGD